MEQLMRISDLSVGFINGDDYIEAVKQISFTINKGETLGIVGESGSGKSVTAKAIMQLLSPSAVYGDDSQIEFLSTNLLDLPEKKMQRIRGKEIGMVFQDPMTSLNPTKTVGKQITESIRKHQKLTPHKAKQEALVLMEKVGIAEVEQRFKQYPHEFSGGMRQRIVIAIALASKPRLLIADEPTTALDVTVQAQLLDLLKDIQAETGTSILLITHDFGVVAELCDRVIVMKEGEIVEENQATDIFDYPQHPYTKRLLDAFPKMMTDKEEPTFSDNKPLLQVRNLKQYFQLAKGHVTKAVNDVSFTIYEGESFGFVGESGSGKSTTGRSLLHLHKPTSGEVLYEGFDLGHLTPNELKHMRRHIQIIFQDPYASLDPRLKIIDSIGEALDLHQLVQTKQERYTRVVELLTLVGLDRDMAYRYPHEFSGGQRQRIGIARALAVQPKLIVCDEILSALDASIQTQMIELLKDLQQKLGLTYLFIAHDLSMVQQFCDRVAVMYKGRIVEMGSTKRIFEQPHHPYTKNLLAAIPITNPSLRRYEPVPTLPLPFIEEEADHELVEQASHHWVARSAVYEKITTNV
ncbi:ABC transporter ATP-binding protein [Shouchella lehensis]|uniref:ABC transporter ATP-binding protein n=1 Tax=Shouchella lehensis TaxID=300825 RepID=A0A4Y7WMA2_9BACI|nr:ABC transporter ATP-binding protein [Shouchella lehensis]MBG9783022.1 ABC transporter ATP-binding protein [Shouchella lehensis]TES49622.1 ABC transporter ATP-binding protein [Shouchella lehensis]